MVKPALKSVIPYFHDGHSIHFRMAGELLTLDNEDGQVGALVKLLDGTRTIDEICDDFRAAFPHVERSTVQEALQELDAERLLEDAAASTERLTSAQLDRWSRSLAFFETFASLAVSKYLYQRRLMDTKVAVLGVGGVGCHVLMDLVALGFTDIRIVDFDRVEASNLNRQVLYGDHCLGERKTRIATEWARRFRNDIAIQAVERKLMSAEDVYEVVHDRDIVLSALDRPKTRILLWLNEACVRAGVPLITGGVDTQRWIHHTMLPGITGCLQCWQLDVFSRDEVSQHIFNGLRQREDATLTFPEDLAAFGGLVVPLAGFMVNEAVRLATRVCQPLAPARLLQQSYRSPAVSEHERWSRMPDCPVCRDIEPRPSLAWVDLAQQPPVAPVSAWAG